MSATLANLRTAGCLAFRALHKSYCVCMFIHNSGVVPKAAARRIAMDAEIPALPFSTRERVTRVIRKCAAALVTGTSPRYSRRTRPGCGGLCIAFAPCFGRETIIQNDDPWLVIVLIVHEDCVLSFKLERHTPVPADVDCPVIFEMAGEAMKPPSRRIHIFRPLGTIQREQLQTKLVGMLGLNVGFRSHFKELFQATVAEALDHPV
jgi:hypothetical protein